MTDDRYTVDDPPHRKAKIFVAHASVGETSHYDSPPHHSLLEAGLVHRTRESAKAHARRMVMADEILEALEMLIDGKLINGDGGEIAQWAVKRVIAKARGKVAP